MLYLIEKKDSNALYWMNKIINLESNIRRDRRKGNVWLIWDYLINSVKENHLFYKTMIALYDLYKDNLGEKNLFLISAMLYHLNDIDWNIDNVVIPFNTNNINSYYEKNISNNKIKLDNYIYDKHCSEGRKEGKNFIDFANEGSFVVNEDKKYLNSRLRDLYKEWKMIQNLESLKKKTKKKKL